MQAIRDPVHGWIEYNEGELAIINSKFFQRLRWVNQLTVVHYVFPGATHSRFSHSLGVMKLAGKHVEHLITEYVDKLLPKDKKYYIQLARIAGLLHDIGHGPFSHSFDRIVYKDIYNVEDKGHDLHRLKIIQNPKLKSLIEKLVTVDDLIAVWNSKGKPPKHMDFGQNILGIIGAILQGPLGADRIDFTLRDSYFAGTAHLGTIAHKRITSNSKLLLMKGCLYLQYHTKCLPDIIQALTGRFYMYDGVYLHKTVQAATILVEKMMDAAKIDLQLVRKTQNLDEFVWMSDTTLIGSIMSLMDEHPARNYLQLLMSRRLPKLVEEHKIFDETPVDVPDGLISIETRYISGINPRDFDKFNIYFNQMTCQEALAKEQYVEPRKPRRIVRIYKMS